jgi:hypothetical protein
MAYDLSQHIECSLCYYCSDNPEPASLTDEEIKDIQFQIKNGGYIHITTCTYFCEIVMLPRHPGTQPALPLPLTHPPPPPFPSPFPAPPSFAYVGQSQQKQQQQ